MWYQSMISARNKNTHFKQCRWIRFPLNAEVIQSFFSIVVGTILAYLPMSSCAPFSLFFWNMPFMFFRIHCLYLSPFSFLSIFINDVVKRVRSFLNLVMFFLRKFRERMNPNETIFRKWKVLNATKTMFQTSSKWCFKIDFRFLFYHSLWGRI